MARGDSRPMVFGHTKSEVAFSASHLAWKLISADDIFTLARSLDARGDILLCYSVDLNKALSNRYRGQVSPSPTATRGLARATPQAISCLSGSPRLGAHIFVTQFSKLIALNRSLPAV